MRGMRDDQTAMLHTVIISSDVWLIGRERLVGWKAVCDAPATKFGKTLGSSREFARKLVCTVLVLVDF